MLKIWYSKKHSFFTFVFCLKIEKIIIFSFVMRWVGHRMMNNHSLQSFDRFVLRETVLNLSSSFMMKVDDANANNRLIVFGISLIIFLYSLSKEQSFALKLIIVGWDMSLRICGKQILIGLSFSFNHHIVFVK